MQSYEIFIPFSPPLLNSSLASLLRPPIISRNSKGDRGTPVEDIFQNKKRGSCPIDQRIERYVSDAAHDPFYEIKGESHVG